MNIWSHSSTVIFKFPFSKLLPFYSVLLGYALYFIFCTVFILAPLIKKTPLVKSYILSRIIKARIKKPIQCGNIS